MARRHVRPPGGTTERLHGATIIDVAQRAGVSHSTVSRVLTGAVQPKPHTAEVVARAVEELGYRADGVARSLRTGKTQLIGLVVDDLADPALPDLVRAVDAAANAAGYALLHGAATGTATHVVLDLDRLVERGVDGLIVAWAQAPELPWKHLLGSRVPVVLMDAERPELPLAQVGSNSAAGSHLAAQHLIGLGHRRIAYVRGPRGSRRDLARFAGFRATCMAAGVPGHDLKELWGNGSFDGGARAVRRLLSSRTDVTAIACHNDRTAIGVIKALRQAGRRVPDDVSVIGFGDTNEAAWVDPALTTVTQPTAEVGRRAVDLLVELINGREPKDGPGSVQVPVALRVRSSTAPPRDQGLPPTTM